jgi:hypothetical protein
VGVKSFGGVMLLGALLLAVPASSAEKVIVISDSLVANADRMKASRGAEWLGHFKWRFGDYAVVASKTGWTSTDTKTNFWKTKTESKSVQKFSFTLANGTTDSAMVDTAHEFLAESHHPVKLGQSVSFGSSEVRESESFYAFITLTGDTSEAWTLSMGGTSVENADSGQAERATYRTVLTRGERTITLAPVTSRKPGGDRGSFFSRIMPPAMGYEFVENGRSLCAVQYFPGSARVDRYYVWIHKEPDPRMKLVLAAAVTAVLQKQCSPGVQEPVEEEEEK